MLTLHREQRAVEQHCLADRVANTPAFLTMTDNIAVGLLAVGEWCSRALLLHHRQAGRFHSLTNPCRKQCYWPDIWKSSGKSIKGVRLGRNSFASEVTSLGLGCNCAKA